MAPEDLGTRKEPIDFGKGLLAYKHRGRWKYRTPETRLRFGSKFIDVTDQELALELEARGCKILYPAHECIDRPNLPCPACERILFVSARRRQAG